MIFQFSNLEDTETFVKSFVKQIKPGLKIGLCGDLGAGKTSFVRLLYEALDGQESELVTSPTFTLFQEYQTSLGPVYHFDLYRLNSFEEFENLDFDFYLEDQKAITLIEWVDRFEELVQECDIILSFKITGETCRSLEVKLKDQNS